MYVCHSNCPFLPFSKETNANENDCLPSTLNSSEKNATIGCHFLMLPHENCVIAQRRGKKILCATFLARVQLYNHAP